MKTRDTHRKGNEGFIFIWVLGIVSVAALFLHMGMEALWGTMQAAEFLEEKETCNHLDSIAKTILWEHALHEVKGSCTFNTQTERLTEKLTWALPPNISLINITRSPISKRPFEKSKEATELDYHPLNTAHPLGEILGYTFHQEVSMRFFIERTGKKYAPSFKIFLKEIPSSELELIVPYELSPGELKIPIANRYRTLTSAYRPSLEKGGHTIENVIASFISKKDEQKLNLAENTAFSVSPFFAFGYGQNPFKYFRPDGNELHLKEQAYVNHPKAKIIQFDGENIFQSIPGIEVRPFNQGPKRVIINLAKLPESFKNLYILCTTKPAEELGIVLRGDNQGKKHFAKSIVTNGHTWLWGNHNICTIVATTKGYWTFTDDSWTEGSGSTKPLDLIWNGYMASPYTRSVFSSPQSHSKNGKLTLNGTLLLGGTLAGNLGKIDILRTRPNPDLDLAVFSERFIIPLDIQKI